MRRSLCLLAILAASPAFAQSANPFPDGFASDPYPAGFTADELFDAVGPAPLAGAASYTPDTRPGYIIAAYEGGAHDSLGLGRRGWWRDRTDDGFEMGQSGNQLSDVIPPVSGNGSSTASNGIVDAVDMLVALLDQGYDRGFRRFIINRPAGFDNYLVSTQTGDLPNACWWSLDETVREDLADSQDAASSADGSAGGLAWWIDNHSDASVGIYVGFRAGDPWSTLHSVEPLDADRRSDAWALYRNIKPWADLGVTEFVFDHVGGVTDNDADAEARSDSLHRLRAHAAFSGLHIVGEHPVLTKIPDGSGGFAGSGDLDEDRVEDNPWVLWAERLLVPSIDGDEVWDITALVGEINVVFDYHSTTLYRDFDRDKIASIVDRGFTAWSAGASRLSVSDESIEMIRWVYYDDYSSPTLEPSCLADLNMDGVVDDVDGDIVYNHAAYGAPSPTRAWHGDLNLDGVVNSGDFTIWLNIATAAGYSSGNSVSCP